MKGQSLGKGCCTILASLVLLTGCASKYGQQITDVVYYPQCYSPIAELRKDESNYRTTMATSTVVGALLGALGGYAATGNTKGTLIGAGAGAAGGAAVGYMTAEAEEERNTNKRMSGYMQSLEGDISNLNAIKASAKMALQCYDREFKQAVAAYKGKRISRVDLDNRYGEIKNGSTEASRILGEAIDSTVSKEQQYQAALNDETERRNQPVTTTASTSAAKKPAKTTSRQSTAQTKPTQPAKVVTTSNDPELAQMARKTQNLSQERQSLQAVSADVSRKQSAWAAELAAIES